MVCKLAGYEDLFAYDAKYHKSCYCRYIGKRNIKACQNKSAATTTLQSIKDQSDTSESETISSDSEPSTKIKSSEHSQTFEENEILILYKEAGILKKKIKEFKTPKSYFPTPGDINQRESLKIKFLMSC